MKGSSVFKSQKLLKVSVEHDGDCLQSVTIHGDFFLYPEDAIVELESGLQGVALERGALEGYIAAFSARVQVFGFSASDLTSAILMAAGKEPKPV
ncbi:hypothetical protein HYV43_05430 [Candidatus Micrarchaeota archaeon]|nr:hypothetical protein [Candidatus Micrarchaeota archaeon]